MTKYGGNFRIFPKFVEQSSEDYKLATGHTGCIYPVIFDNDHLPPIEEATCVFARGCTEQHSSQLMALAIGKVAVDGADNFQYDTADADAVRVQRWQDLGSHLLLEIVEFQLPVEALEILRDDDEVDAFGVGHDLVDADQVDGDRPTADNDSLQGGKTS